MEPRVGYHLLYYLYSRAQLDLYSGKYLFYFRIIILSRECLNCFDFWILFDLLSGASSDFNV